LFDIEAITLEEMYEVEGISNKFIFFWLAPPPAPTSRSSQAQI